jgi:hypothetical protein
VNLFFSSIIQGLIAILWSFSFDIEMPAPDVEIAVMLMMKNFSAAAADDFNEIFLQDAFYEKC